MLLQAILLEVVLILGPLVDLPDVELMAHLSTTIHPFFKQVRIFFKPHFSASAGAHDEGSLQISNQEFVQNIYGNDSGVSFTSTSFNINPGLAEVFPMLSQFAINFERYEMIQCAFHFETQLDAGIIQSTTGQVGDILMYSHSDPSQSLLQNVSEFQQNGGASSRITQGLIQGIECDPEQMHGLNNAGLNYIRNTPKDDLD